MMDAGITEVTLEDIMVPEGEEYTYEEDAKLDERFIAWAEEQPEWDIVKGFDLATRQEFAYRFMGTLTAELNLAPKPGRAVTRKMQAQQARKLSKAKTVVQARGARHQARLEKQRARAMRMSVARAEELAYEWDEKRTAMAALIAAMEAEEAAKAAEEEPDEAAQPDEA